MRPLLAMGVVFLSLGAVYRYVTFVDSFNAQAPSGYREIQAEGRFHVDLTLTFDARGDIFSQETVLLQLHGGRELLRSEDPVAAGTVLKIDPVEGIVVGPNEFYLKVSTAEEEPSSDSGFSLEAPSFDEDPLDENDVEQSDSSDKSRAVRIRIFRDDLLLAEQTFWSEPGQAVDGVFQLDVPATGGSEETHEHDHSHDAAEAESS